MKKDKCLKCGACCYYFGFNSELKRCQYLSNNLCKIYSTRIGAVIDEEGDKKLYCLARKDDMFDYPNCPYNNGRLIFDRKLFLKEEKKMINVKSPQETAIHPKAGSKKDDKYHEPCKESQKSLNDKITAGMGKPKF